MAESKNERLWFKTNMKLANLWVGLKEGGKAAKASHLHLWCREGLGSGCRGRKQRPVFPDHRKDGIAWSCCCTSQRRCVACVHTPDSQCRLLVALVCPLAAGAARAAPLLPDGGWAGRPEEGHAGGAGAGREGGRGSAGAAACFTGLPGRLCKLFGQPSALPGVREQMLQMLQPAASCPAFNTTRPQLHQTAAPPTRPAAAGDLRAGDPDAHGAEEQQEAQGAVPGGAGAGRGAKPACAAVCCRLHKGCSQLERPPVTASFGDLSSLPIVPTPRKRWPSSRPSRTRASWASSASAAARCTCTSACGRTPPPTSSRPSSRTTRWAGHAHVEGLSGVRCRAMVEGLPVVRCRGGPAASWRVVRRQGGRWVGDRVTAAASIPPPARPPSATHLLPRPRPPAHLLSRRAAAGGCSASSTWCWPTC